MGWVGRGGEEQSSLRSDAVGERAAPWRSLPSAGVSSGAGCGTTCCRRPAPARRNFVAPVVLKMAGLFFAAGRVRENLPEEEHASF